MFDEHEIPAIMTNIFFHHLQLLMVKFTPSPHLGPEGKIGRLTMDMSSKLLINDLDRKTKFEK